MEKILQQLENFWKLHFIAQHAFNRNDYRQIRLIEADENQLEAHADLKVSGDCDQLLKILSIEGVSFNPKINLAGDVSLPKNSKKLS